MTAGQGGLKDYMYTGVNMHTRTMSTHPSSHWCTVMVSWLHRAENTSGWAGATGGSTVSFCFSSFVCSLENWICYGWAHLHPLRAALKTQRNIFRTHTHTLAVCGKDWIINMYRQCWDSLTQFVLSLLNTHLYCKSVCVCSVTAASAPIHK